MSPPDADPSEDEVPLDLTHPPEFARAPAWARALFDQQRTDRHATRNELQKLSGEMRQVKKALGEEPDSDGKGGKGLIGDVRKMGRDLQGLLDLRTMGIGAVAAVTLFGALIVLGVIHWVQSIGAHK